MQTIEVYKRDDFRKWLRRNHKRERKVALIVHKKHTKKSSPSHRELMEEAICFGWIDTTIKRVDEDKYIRHFTKRTKNSTWSNNTLSYAKDLKEKEKMSKFGIEMYEQGLKKLPHDHNIPKNPEMPEELKEALEKNSTAKSHFNKFPPSTRKMMYRWLLRAKLPETKKKRISKIITLAKEGRKDIF